MAESTGIAWADATFNPWVGCEKVSPGCAHCYAETVVTGRMGRPGTWGADGVRQVTSDSNWKKPIRWARLAAQGLLPDRSENPDGHRPRVFCASLADVFEPRPELAEPRARLFSLIAATPELDWLILTKRPEFARDWLRGLAWEMPGDGTRGRATNYQPSYGIPAAPLPNVWLGVSIENARHTWRADVLREIPAAVRFISAEPLLGSLYTGFQCPRCNGGGLVPPGSECPTCAGMGTRNARPGSAPLDLTDIDWIIVGGESVHGARPMRAEWAREIIHAAMPLDSAPLTTAVFVKQLGATTIISREELAARCAVGIECEHGYDVCPECDADDTELPLVDRKGGDWDEWPADLRIRDFPSPVGALA